MLPACLRPIFSDKWEVSRIELENQPILKQIMNRKLQLKVDIKFGGFLKIRHFLTAIISEIKAIKKMRIFRNNISSRRHKYRQAP